MSNELQELYIAHLLRDKINELRYHISEGGQYGLVYKKTRELCEKYDFKHDGNQNSQWNDTQLTEFVEEYTRKAMEKAKNEIAKGLINENI